MPVVAPPRPPRVDEPAGDEAGEALIREAKQRARRRRFVYCGAAAIVAIGPLGAFAALATSTAPPDAGARPEPNPPTPRGAPLVVGADAGSTMLASWAQFHTGYVFVYGDGRVI